MDRDSCRGWRRPPGRSYRGPERSIRRGSPCGSARPIGAGGRERLWGSRPFSPVPRGSASGGAGWGRSRKRAVAAALARGQSCLYLAAQEWAGAMPEGAAQSSARRSAARALPGNLPPAARPSSLGLFLALPREEGALVLPGSWTGARTPSRLRALCSRGMRE